MKTFPARWIYGCQNRSVIEGKIFLRQRTGTSVLETTIVMALIVGVLIFILTSLSGGMRNLFSQTQGALAGNGQSGRAKSAASVVSSSTEPAQSETSIGLAEQLLTTGLFITAVGAFLGYTVFFMSRTESGNAVVKDQPDPTSAERKATFMSQLLGKRGRIGKMLRDEMLDFDCDHLTVAKFMTPNPKVVNKQDKLSDIVELMSEQGFRHLIVVDERGHMCGIISDRDLIRLKGKTVGDVMTPNPIFGDVTTPITISITMLVQNRISALPILDGTKVAGILTRSDLLVTLQCLLVNVQEDKSHHDLHGK